MHPIYGTTKRCAYCKRWKEISAFSPNGRYLQSYCKACCLITYTAYAKKNRKKLKAYTVSYATRNLKLLDELRSVPCEDCGKTYPPYVMDFDHRPGTKKLTKVSAMARSAYSEQAILREIRKCDVVCSNCHRMRTHARKHGADSLRTQLAELEASDG